MPYLPILQNYIQLRLLCWDSEFGKKHSIELHLSTLLVITRDEHYIKLHGSQKNATRYKMIGCPQQMKAIFLTPSMVYILPPITITAHHAQVRGMADSSIMKKCNL